MYTFFPKSRTTRTTYKESAGKPLLSTLLLGLLVVFSAVTNAAHHESGHPTLWQLDSADSSLSFVSVKAGDVAEAHKFGALSGGLVIRSSDAGAAAGNLNIKIDLATVNTNIAVRDERIREHLFETATFPEAVVHGQFPIQDYLDLPIGSSVKATLKLMLDLHGIKAPVAAEVLVSRLGDSRIMVASVKPVVVNAASYGLVAGVEKLRELAGLPSISKAVPVTFVLMLDRAAEAK